MEDLATVFIIIILIIWSIYAIHCFRKGESCERKFFAMHREKRCRCSGDHSLLVFTCLTHITKNPSGTMNVTIYGTQHSLSYLVSNARLLNRRQQRIDMIAQVQHGIRVFDLNIRLEKSEECMTKDSVTQKIYSRVNPFFKTKILRYNTMSFRPFVTTNNVDSNLSVWHVFNILNQTARCCAIAKLIIIVSFISENKYPQLADDPIVQQHFLKQIQDEKFDHLFIILASNVHAWFDKIQYHKNAIQFTASGMVGNKNTVNLLNRENTFIKSMVNKEKTTNWQHGVTLVWLKQFFPF